MSAPPPDCIHIHEVSRVEYHKLTDDRLGEPSATVRASIEHAREPQKVRFVGRTGGPSGNVPLVCSADTSAPRSGRKPDGARRPAAQMQVWPGGSAASPGVACAAPCCNAGLT